MPISSSTPQTPQWRERIERIDCPVQELRLPDEATSQDQEWCEVVIDGRRERVRFHDYSRIYNIPGLYEQLFYERLECCSPSRVVHLLSEVREDLDPDAEPLKTLDVGAGNGMVGDELRAVGADTLEGIDIIDEAKTAALRDRPNVYDHYTVADLTNLPEHVEQQLRDQKFNSLTTVAALGFGDIPPAAFIKALDVIETPAWLAFNVKEDFLAERDDSGFASLVHELNREEIIQIQSYRRYQHRLAMDGRPLYYVAIVARKLRDLPDHFMDAA